MSFPRASKAQKHEQKVPNFEISEFRVEGSEFKF